MVPDQTQLRSKAFLIRPKCARWGYDQTQLRSKSPLIRQKCARRGYDQTQLRSKSPLIRQKCARRGYDQTQLRSKSPLIRQKCAQRGYDQTQLRSKSPLIRQKCARRGYDQTQLRSKSPLIRPKCARIRLWSDFSDQNDFWSDHLQTAVQTVVRSNFRKDPVISVWEHTGVRSTGSDHNSIWVWTSTWDSIKSQRVLSFWSQCARYSL